MKVMWMVFPMIEMRYFAVVVKADRQEPDNRPKRYRYYAASEDEAYRKFCREYEPNLSYVGPTNKILKITPICKDEWNHTLDKHSINQL